MEENGFTIARVKVCGQRDLVTVVGNLGSFCLIGKKVGYKCSMSDFDLSLFSFCA